MQLPFKPVQYAQLSQNEIAATHELGLVRTRHRNDVRIFPRGPLAERPLRFLPRLAVDCTQYQEWCYDMTTGEQGPLFSFNAIALSAYINQWAPLLIADAARPGSLLANRVIPAYAWGSTEARQVIAMNKANRQSDGLVFRYPLRSRKDRWEDMMFVPPGVDASPTIHRLLDAMGVQDTGEEERQTLWVRPFVPLEPLREPDGTPKLGLNGWPLSIEYRCVVYANGVRAPRDMNPLPFTQFYHPDEVDPVLRAAPGSRGRDGVNGRNMHAYDLAIAAGRVVSGEPVVVDVGLRAGRTGADPSDWVVVECNSLSMSGLEGTVGQFKTLYRKLFNLPRASYTEDADDDE